MSGISGTYEKLTLAGIEAAIAGGIEILKAYEMPVDAWTKEDRSPVTVADLSSHQKIQDILKSTRITVISEEAKLRPSRRKGKKRFWLVDPLDGTREFLQRNGEFCVLIALIEDGKPRIGILYVPIGDVLYVGIQAEEKVFFRVKGARYLLGMYGSVDEWMSAGEAFRREERSIPTAEELVNGTGELRIVVSRSHIDKKTEAFVEALQREIPSIRILQRGSALKFLDVARNKADIYPRFSPVHVWDVAPGILFLQMMEGVFETPAGTDIQIQSDREAELIPAFIAWSHPDLRARLFQIVGPEFFQEFLNLQPQPANEGETAGS